LFYTLVGSRVDVVPLSFRLQDDQEVEKQQPVPMSDERQEPKENLKVDPAYVHAKEALALKAVTA